MPNIALVSYSTKLSENEMDYKIYQTYRGMATHSLPAIKALRNSARGKTVFIVGTGPSIMQTDLSKLTGETVIFLNNALHLLDRFTPGRSFLALSDFLRAIELRGEIQTRGIPCITTSDKVMNPRIHSGFYADPFLFVMPKLSFRDNGTAFISPANGFSSALEEGIYLGKSVVFPAIQIAYYLGAASIALVGIDMTIGKKAAYYNSNIQSNWGAFDYPRDGRPHFAAMYDALSERGILLENLTVGGVLDVLPHDPIRLALPDARDALRNTG